MRAATVNSRQNARGYHWRARDVDGERAVNGRGWAGLVDGAALLVRAGHPEPREQVWHALVPTSSRSPAPPPRARIGDTLARRRHPPARVRTKLSNSPRWPSRYTYIRSSSPAAGTESDKVISRHGAAANGGLHARAPVRDNNYWG